jgi:hypothetical protein
VFNVENGTKRTSIREVMAFGLARLRWPNSDVTNE